MAFKAQEIFEQLVRPEFRNWKIALPDGHCEDFDPLTLAASLIESEIEIPAAVAIYDDVVERLKPHARESPLTHDAIHHSVIDALLEYQSPKASVWLANYDNLFASPIEQAEMTTDEVDVRHVASLKAALFENLAKFLGKESGEEVTEALSQNELSAITDRIVRIIRYCGFHHISRNFLASFVAELAAKSTKTFLSASSINDEDLEAVYNEAERWFLSAREAKHGSTAKRMTLLRLGLEEMSSATLLRLGRLPHSTSCTSFDHLRNLLRELISFPVGNGHDANGWQPVHRALRQQAIPITAFVESWGALHKSVEKEFPERACREALALLAHLRTIFMPNELVERLRCAGSGRNSIEIYVQLSVEILKQHGIEAIPLPDGRAVQIPTNYSFHRLLEHGRQLWVRFDFGATPGIDHTVLRATLDDMGRKNGTIPVLVMNRDMSAEDYSVLRAQAMRTHTFCCALSHEDYERMLSRPKDFRDEILRLGEKLVPDAAKWGDKIFPDDGLRLPKNLNLYEREALTSIIGALQRGRSAEGCREVGVLVEAACKEYFLFIVALARTVAGDTRIRQWLGSTGSLGMGAYISGLREVAESLSKDDSFRRNYGKVLPQERLVARIDASRLRRNDYSHMNREVDENEAKAFVAEIGSVIGSIHAHMEDFERSIIIEGRATGTLVFSENRGEFRLKTDYALSADPANFPIAAYVERTERSPLVVSALGVCAECRGTVPMHGIKDGRSYRCELCRRPVHCEVAWTRLARKFTSVKKTPFPTEAASTSTKLGPAVPMNIDAKKIRPWIAGIAELVGTVAGPKGLILKALLKIREAQRAAELNEKIDGLVSRGQQIQESVIREAFETRGELKQAVDIAVKGVTDHINKSLLAGDSPDKLVEGLKLANGWSNISLTTVSFRITVEELTALYSGNMDLFFSDLKMAGHNISRIRKTGTPQVDVAAFVDSVRSYSFDDLKQIFGYLSQQNPGAKNLGKIYSDLKVVDHTAAELRKSNAIEGRPS